MEPTEGLVVSEVRDSIAVISLNAPPVNALSSPVVAELEKAIAAIEQRKDVRVLVLTGRGKCFSAGADIRQLAGGVVQDNEAYFHQIYRALARVEAVKVPVIAAINGHAMGAGMELSLCADIRVMDEAAKLGATSVNLGLVFCTQRLPRLIGYSRGRELLLTARHVGAAEAEQWGIVHYITPPGGALDQARQLAELIASKSQKALWGVKQALREGQGLELEVALRNEAGYLHQLLATSDFHERTRRFLEERGGIPDYLTSTPTR